MMLWSDLLVVVVIGWWKSKICMLDQFLILSVMFFSEPVVDLQLPVNNNATEVRTIVLAAEPKIKFKEKTVESLGIRSTGSKPVEFKKRKLNSGAVKGNIRRADDQDT